MAGARWQLGAVETCAMFLLLLLGQNVYLMSSCATTVRIRDRKDVPASTSDSG